MVFHIWVRKSPSSLSQRFATKEFCTPSIPKIRPSHYRKVILTFFYFSCEMLTFSQIRFHEGFFAMILRGAFPKSSSLLSIFHSKLSFFQSDRSVPKIDQLIVPSPHETKFTSISSLEVPTSKIFASVNLPNLNLLSKEAFQMTLQSFK